MAGQPTVTPWIGTTSKKKGRFLIRAPINLGKLQGITSFRKIHHGFIENPYFLPYFLGKVGHRAPVFSGTFAGFVFRDHPMSPIEVLSYTSMIGCLGQASPFLFLGGIIGAGREM